ncbi:Hypothetical predicted protein [Octopus vulgaris]|uniref:BEN domain-containing protein n=1 Tax=Octopus vulgaris TaxID=6645 RepID=A0AA36BG23_OCTVU|nr:Hypothetical predicted protein [Octopus vulgaris]
MDSLKVNPCCIEVLEQVLAILKKHVSNAETESEFPNDLKNESQHRTVASQLGTIPVHNRTINHHHALSKAQILQSNRSKENHSENQLRFISKPRVNKEAFLVKSTTQPPTTSSNHSSTVPSRNRRISAPLQVTPKIPSHQVVKRPVSASTMKVSTVTSPKTYIREQSVPFQDSLHWKTTLNNGPEVQHINTQNYCLNSQVSSKSVSQITPTPRTTTEQGKPKEVELITGLGVNIPEDELARIQFNATTANDPAILVIALLQHFFSDEVLARSTATSCRGKGRAKHSTSQPLNQQIMEAIRRFSVLYSRKINRSLTETQVNRIAANKIGTAKMALKRRSEENSLASRGPRFVKISRNSESVKPKEMTVPTDEDLNFVIKVEKDNDF